MDGAFVSCNIFLRILFVNHHRCWTVKEVCFVSKNHSLNLQIFFETFHIEINSMLWKYFCNCLLMFLNLYSNLCRDYRLSDYRYTRRGEMWVVFLLRKIYITIKITVEFKYKRRKNIFDISQFFLFIFIQIKKKEKGNIINHMFRVL